MEIKVFENYDELSKSAAKVIINQIQKKGNSVLGLATGSSPIGLYQELIKDHKENKTSYKDVITFNLDEYYGITKDHPQSYYNFMLENFFQYIDVQNKNINIPNGDSKNIELECENYNKKLAETPQDIQILGIGTNGHIGFNEPDTPFNSVTHKVKLKEKTRKDNARFFNSLDEVPTFAVSMGIKNILAAKKIILIAEGINKADAIHEMVYGKIDPKCPASVLQKHNSVTVYIDKLAASKLNETHK